MPGVPVRQPVGAAALGDTDGWPTHLAERLESVTTSGATTLNVRHITACHQQQGVHGIAGMQELEPGIETHDSRHDGKRQVAGDVAVHACAHQVRQPESRDHHIGSATASPRT